MQNKHKGKNTGPMYKYGYGTMKMAALVIHHAIV